MKRFYEADTSKTMRPFLNGPGVVAATKAIDEATGEMVERMFDLFDAYNPRASEMYGVARRLAHLQMEVAELQELLAETMTQR